MLTDAVSGGFTVGLEMELWVSEGWCCYGHPRGLCRWKMLFAPVLLEMGRVMCHQACPGAVGSKVTPGTLTWVLQSVFQLGMKPVHISVVLLRQRLTAYISENKSPSKSGSIVE